jgi:hypothetical protein
MNRDLETGMVEASHRMVVKDRGGIVEQTTWEARKELSDTYHGIHESASMHTPDGLRTTDPYYVPTAKPEPESF